MRTIAWLTLVTASCLAFNAAHATPQPRRIAAPGEVSVTLPSGWRAGQQDAHRLQLVPTDPAANDRAG